MRLKESTSTVLVPPILDKQWWTDAMECSCYLRNIQDLFADGKTPYERRFGEHFAGPDVCRWRKLMKCDGRMNSCLLPGLKGAVTTKQD